MTAKQKQLYGDLDDLLIFSEGYLEALKRGSKRDKLIKQTEIVIAQIRARYQKQIDELYAPSQPHPDCMVFGHQ